MMTSERSRLLYRAANLADAYDDAARHIHQVFADQTVPNVPPYSATATVIRQLVRELSRPPRRQ